MALDYKQRAQRARRLLANEDFKAVLEDLRERQKDTFAMSGAGDVDKREDAHAILRAINEIGYLLRADVDAEVLIDKKGSAPS